MQASAGNVQCDMPFSYFQTLLLFIALKRFIIVLAKEVLLILLEEEGGGGGGRSYPWLSRLLSRILWRYSVAHWDPAGATGLKLQQGHKMIIHAVYT